MQAVWYNRRVACGQEYPGTRGIIHLFAKEGGLIGGGRARRSWEQTPSSCGTRYRRHGCNRLALPITVASVAGRPSSILAPRITACMCIASLRSARAPRRCGAPLRHTAPRLGQPRGWSHTRGTLWDIASFSICSIIKVLCRVGCECVL